MNTQQWKTFFEKENHTKKEIEEVTKHACDWRKCVIGAKLRKIYNLSEKQFLEVPYHMVQALLTKKAYKLGSDLNIAFPDEIPKAKEIFKQISKIDASKTINNYS